MISVSTKICFNLNGRKFFIRRSECSIENTFLHTCLVCVAQFKYSSIWTPRVFTLALNGISKLFTITAGRTDFFNFDRILRFPSKIACDFSRFRINPNFCDQEVRDFKSEFNLVILSFTESGLAWI